MKTKDNERADALAQEVASLRRELVEERRARMAERAPHDAEMEWEAVNYDDHGFAVWLPNREGTIVGMGATEREAILDAQAALLATAAGMLLELAERAKRGET